MRCLTAAGLVAAALALAGCSADDPCAADLPDRAVVQAMSGRDAHVLLDDGEPAVLHLATVFAREDGACLEIGASGVKVGDTLAFDVDVWAESYPMQGWPERTIVLGDA